MTDLKSYFALSFFLLFTQIAQAQEPRIFSVTVNGKFYQITHFDHTPQKKNRKVLRRDFVVFHIETRTDKDSVLKSTFKENPSICEISVEEARYANKGFLEEMLLQMNVGDSATFLLDVEMVFDAIKKTPPKFLHPNTQIKYILKVLKVQDEQQVKNAKEEILFQQKKADEKIIAQYIAKNKISAKRTYSGIYYFLENEGEGDFAVKDDVVSIRYVAKFLDGKEFSSSDKDGRLFEFPVGGGFTIKALDQIMLLMRKGSKGTFIVPSYLAWGKEGFPGVIPPNAPIIYEIEFIDIVIHKLIIENKGEILQKEREQAEKNKKKEPSEEERIKQIEKDAKKKGINIKGNQ